jgi:hypothetical protein
MHKMKTLLWILGLSLILLPLMAFQEKQATLAAQVDTVLSNLIRQNVANQANSEEDPIAQQETFVDEIQSLIAKWQGSSLVGEG